MTVNFRRFSFITLVLIYLVIIAGSVVRTTGSGMGCPDWPKCFGSYAPPTSEDQLPENYREIYREHRIAKIEKFCSLLRIIGLQGLSDQLAKDESIRVEEDFSVSKAWTEYGNRLVGFMAGNFVLILFIWTLIRFRSEKKLVWLAFVNLMLMAFEGWLGSIVVASNLVPWTITIHMLMALIIVGIQIKIWRIAIGGGDAVQAGSGFRYLFMACLALTFVQILLGAQVRQEVDFLVRDMVDRSEWIGALPRDFLFHRSFSWALLAGVATLWWMNRKQGYQLTAISWMAVIVLMEFITGVLFSYAGMPALLQPFHLLLASILLGLQFFTWGRLKSSAG